MINVSRDAAHLDRPLTALNMRVSDNSFWPEEDFFESQSSMSRYDVCTRGSSQVPLESKSASLSSSVADVAS